MPNYKQCRFCTEKYVPVRNEVLCPKCSKAVVDAVQMPVGEPIVVADMSDETVKEIKDALASALPKEVFIVPPEPEIIGVSEIVPESIEVEIVEASPENLQKEKDLEVMEDAIVELDKGENAEIIGPSAPKPDVPEEKPDATS